MGELCLNGVDAKMLGPTGAVGDLSWTTRWGRGACGMFEASWTMPLPADFEHPSLRRGTVVELMAGPLRVGSPLILTEPARGSGPGSPWRFSATGVGREVEGENSFYAFDNAGNATSVMQTAIDRAQAAGWRIAGRDSTVFAGAFGADPPEAVTTVGGLLSSVSDYLNQRWGVWDDNRVGFRPDPVSPSWQTVPDVVALGTADDDYATVVYLRYVSSSTHLYATATSPASMSPAEARYGRREYMTQAPPGMGEIDAPTAQALADGILAKSKGRLQWANDFTLSSNQLLTIGGVPADLSMVEAGQMVRVHGVFNDLLEYNGQTWLDVVMGEVTYTAGAQTVLVKPLGLAARDLAAVVEEVTGYAMDAA